MPFLYPLEVLENTVYLSLGSISLSLGISSAFVKALHSTPLSRTASMTLSTSLSRLRWFAFRVLESLHGIFHSNPDCRSALGVNGPNIAESKLACS